MSNDRITMPEMPEEITRWLQAREVAPAEALPQLFSALYADLKRRAHFALGASSPSGTLNTTGLVNEAYLRLSAAEAIQVHDRRHFLALAAKTMRWVVMDYARARKRQRRGGELQRVSLDEAMVMAEEQADELLNLDAALLRLTELEPRLAEVVEYRFFGGLNVEDTAVVLHLSPRTVKRDWRAARAFLAREMGPTGTLGGASP